MAAETGAVKVADIGTAIKFFQAMKPEPGAVHDIVQPVITQTDIDDGSLAAMIDRLQTELPGVSAEFRDDAEGRYIRMTF
ncbi:hypothetical protein ACFL04_00485 [Patescibacteria group bacterium]